MLDGMASPLLFPDRCRLCDRLFHRQQPVEPPAGGQLHEALTPLACPDCLASLMPLRSPCCTACGRPFTGPAGSDHLCGECTRKPFPFRTARAAGLYRDALMRAIQAFKYRGNMEVGAALGRYLHHFFLSLPGHAEIDIVAPVPLHTSRMRARGFNQAWYMIRQWGREKEGQRRAADAGNGNSFSVCRDLLERTRATPSQVGLTPRERRVNIRNAFRVAHPRKAAGRKILLVDDVLTTGATAAECARTLLAAGAAAVDILTLARTP
jgi:ComF family protein